MKKTTTTIRILVIGSVLALGAGAALAQADLNESYGDEYAEGDYGRVLYEDAGLTIVRSGEPDRGSVNAPLFPGDSVETDGSQRVEIELADGTLVRVDRRTAVTFLSMPAASARYRDNTVLQLAEGTIRLSARSGEEAEFRVDTPAASVYLIEDGEFRIETFAGGRTIVSALRGVAEVSGQGGSVLVRSGTRVEAFPGAVPGEAYAFNTLSTDAFDRWVGERDAAYRVRERYGEGGDYGDRAAYEEIPVEVQPYYRELSRNGRWVYVADYGYCWYPVGVSAGWRPYSDGYWTYGPSGYFWVSYEPWGWAPYHYGRWTWVSRFGWCWVPGRVFGGAWVSWSWGSAYIGWAPLDCYDRPVFIGTVQYGYYDPRCWSFVSYTHIHHRHYRDYYVPPSHIGRDIGRHAVVTRAPRVSPRELESSPDSRTRAYRIAQQDRRRVPQIGDTGARPRSFRDIERGFATRARPAQGNAPRAGGVAARPETVRERFPRRTTAELPRVRERAQGPQGSQGAPTRARRPAARSDSTQERRREYYRQMTRPREAKRRDDERKQPRVGPSVGPTTPSRPSRPQAAPPRSTPSRPSVTPSQRSNRGGATRVTPARPSSPRPQARGGSSRSDGGSRPQARPSGRSGGGSPKARGGSSRDGGSRQSGGSKSKGDGAKSRSKGKGGRR